jgi:DNA (cytosine-5)-methyltransferase 1
MQKFFLPPEPAPEQERPKLRQAISDLARSAKPALDGTYANQALRVPNHEYLVGGFSSMYMSRNRVRAWDEPSFTIQAGGRHAPLHPQAPKMIQVGKDKRDFVPGSEQLYRRLSVREAARIQTFPDDFIFDYANVNDGYKMIGNAVPVEFARRLALQIKSDLEPYSAKTFRKVVPGDLYDFDALQVLSRKGA